MEFKMTEEERIILIKLFERLLELIKIEGDEDE